MHLISVQKPQQRVLTREDVKTQARIETTYYDDLVDKLILAAEQRLDGPRGLLGRALRPQTWRMEMVDWPSNRCIEIPLPPLIAVTAITYLDTSGTEQTLSTSLYRVIDLDESPSLVVPQINSTSWPAVAVGEPDAVRVLFDAGYRSEDSPENEAIPEPIREAAIVVAHALYDDPDYEGIPKVAEQLVAPYRIDRLGASYEY